MKTSTIVFALIIVVLAIPATLYVFKPRVRYVREDIIHIVEKVPETIKADFGPAEPDCTYTSTVTVGEDTISLLASEKTFREVLLGTNEKPIADITSKVIAYATVPVDLLENHITINISRENLAEKIEQTIPRSNKKFWNGFLYGSVAAVLVGGTLYIVLS